MPYNVKGEQRNTGRTHFKKGFTPWNKDKKGIYSEEYRRKISEGGKGRPSPRKGVKLSDETKGKIKKARKAQVNVSGPKGKPWSKERRIAQKPKDYTKPVMNNGREYHPMWNDIRKLIYKRDGWTCQECGQNCGRKNGIACHHIDYDIANNDFSNLITLCASCHAKTNHKRVDWIIRYKNKMEA